MMATALADDRRTRQQWIAQGYHRSQTQTANGVRCLNMFLAREPLIDYACGMNDLHGLFVAAVTPFDEKGMFQPDWQAAHFAWLQEHGVGGVLVAGTNGEGPSLSANDRRALIDAAVANHGTMQLVAGTGTPSLQETIALSRYALQAGVDAVLVIPPFYFRDAPEEGLIRYYQALCSAIDGRILFYHIPRVSGVPITRGLIEAVRASHPQQCYGIKDTGGNATETADLVRTYPDLHVLGGSDHLMLDNLHAGVRGQISGLANAFPELFVGLLRAFQDGEPAEQWQQQVIAVQAVVKRYPYHAAVKALAAQRAGLARSYVKPPLIDLTAEQQEALQDEIKKISIG